MDNKIYNWGILAPGRIAGKFVDELRHLPNARLLAGATEGSNVNAVESMVGLIAASRQFEQQMRLLQTAETNDKTASQLLSMNG